MNFDNKVDIDDSDAFGTAIADAAEYETTYQAPPAFKGDANDDGLFNMDDLDPFTQLLTPLAPAAIVRLASGAASTNSMNLPVSSKNGRYVLTYPYSDANFVDIPPIHVFDTYTGTKFKVGLPPTLGLTGIMSLAISGNGRYLAVTGYSGSMLGTFSPKVFRYDLETGDAFLLPTSGLAHFAAISFDGTLITYRSVESVSGVAHQYVELYDFKTSTRTKVREMEQSAETPLFNNPAVLDASDDGRFILFPASKSVLGPESGRGLVLLDRQTNTETELIPGLPTGFAGGFLISNDGKIALYAVRDSANNTTKVYTHNTMTGVTELIRQYSSSGVPSLALSEDKRYVTTENGHINRVTKAGHALALGGVSLSKIRITGDGKFITYLFPSAGFKDSVYIAPNPLYVDNGGDIPGDFNRDGCVNASDLTLWQATQGTNVPPGSGADANLNGLVDDADRAVMEDFFGDCKPGFEPTPTPTPTMTPTATATATNTPEVTPTVEPAPTEVSTPLPTAVITPAAPAPRKFTKTEVKGYIKGIKGKKTDSLTAKSSLLALLDTLKTAAASGAYSKKDTKVLQSGAKLIDQLLKTAEKKDNAAKKKKLAELKSKANTVLAQALAILG